MILVFCGTPRFAVPTLEKLVEAGHSVPLVVTQPDRPRGRGMEVSVSPVKEAAIRLRISVVQPATIKNNTEFREQLAAIKPDSIIDATIDAIIVVGYGRIIPQWMIDLPRLGNLNLHASLLPKYRGAAPIQWAIANGETETGVTLMKMDAGLDTGPIVLQRRTPILPADDSATLHDRLAQLGAELLAQTIPDFVAGKIQPQPQPARSASHAPKIKKEDGCIDWNLPAKTIRNRLRAFTPWPGAFTFWFGVPPSGGNGIRIGAPPEGGTPYAPRPILLKIWKAETVEQSGGIGEILSADKNGIIIACGQDALRILELQREGGRRMNAAEFLAGHVLNAGGKFE